MNFFHKYIDVYFENVEAEFDLFVLQETDGVIKCERADKTIVYIKNFSKIVVNEK